jgi:hypothetical protein
VGIAACGSSDPSQRSSGRATRSALFDAALNTPLPNPADHSAVIDRSGVVTAIPKSIDTSPPAFKQAA